MTMSMNFFGYDCDRVDKHFQEMDMKQRQASAELMEQCLVRARGNRELAEKLTELSRELEQVQKVERAIMDRLAEQFSGLQKAYKNAFALVEEKNRELNLQVQRIESAKQLLGDWQKLAGNRHASGFTD